MLGSVKSGPDFILEQQAHNLLMQDRRTRGIKGVAVQAEEYSWLSDWQLQGRQDAEVYTSIGYPDPEVMEGTVFRAYNPLFGKRPNRFMTADA